MGSHCSTINARVTPNDPDPQPSTNCPTYRHARLRTTYALAQITAPKTTMACATTNGSLWRTRSHAYPNGVANSNRPRENMATR